MNNLQRTAILLLTAAVSAVGLGCGGGGAANNDQGVAVTFLGYYSAFPSGCTQLPRGLSGAIVPLGDVGDEPVGTISATSPVGLDDASNFVGLVGVQNNLIGQYFRGDRLLLSFAIPGAQIQPPSTTVPLSLFAGPREGSGVQGTPRPIRDPITSLPPSFGSTCNRAFAQTNLLPAAVREWMNFNRDMLPEPPFQMTVSGRITGMSSSGNRYETQIENLLIDIVPETFVRPPAGAGEDTGDTTEGGSTAGQVINDSSDSIAPSDDPASLGEGSAEDDSTGGTL
jgi:hypothetical protein